MSENEAYQWLSGLSPESIYDGKRLAQPDEIANYQTGDGLEKAFLMANILRSRHPQQEIQILAENSTVIVKGRDEYRFES